MIAKLFLFWISLTRLSFEQLCTYFDLYDAVHLLFLGVIGICLRIVQRGSWSVNRKVRSSLRSPTTSGKKRSSVSFAAGTKFYPIQSHSTPVGERFFSYNCMLAGKLFTVGDIFMTSRHQLSSIAFKVLLCGQFVHNAAGLILNILNITRGSVVRLCKQFSSFLFCS